MTTTSNMTTINGQRGNTRIVDCSHSLFAYEQRLEAQAFFGMFEKDHGYSWTTRDLEVPEVNHEWTDNKFEVTTEPFTVKVTVDLNDAWRDEPGCWFIFNPDLPLLNYEQELRNRQTLNEWSKE